MSKKNQQVVPHGNQCVPCNVLKLALGRMANSC